MIANSYNHYFVTEFLSILFLLYAEIHYTIKGIYSRLKMKEPEIIADVPRRLDPGAALPVLILVKDAHLHPIRLHGVHIEIRNRENVQSERCHFDNLQIAAPWWHHILQITPGQNFRGPLQVEVAIEFTCGDRKRVVKSDNYVRTSHTPFEVFIAGQTMPRSPGWYFGEFHCHTSYTSDQVEFGAPPHASALLARAMGLSFFCATDHSYDLDDQPDNYLRSDPDLTKWKSLLAEIGRLNQDLSDFVIVPGEEVSVGNAQNRNVHFLVLNHPEFLPGAGDGAEKWLQTTPDLSIPEVLAKINGQAVAFAAHPCTKPPFPEWLLVRRGNWEWRDCHHARLDGLQIWNGTRDGLEEGKALWVRLLLEGRRLFISGGNDAHGNFNRFRQVGWPFLTMRENHRHLFGVVRTGVLLADGLSLPTLSEGFKAGRMIVTNGPFINITFHNAAGETARLGDEISGNNHLLVLECISTAEFGFLQQVRVYRGNLVTRREEVLFTKESFSNPFQNSEAIPIEESSAPCYVRAELYSKTPTQTLMCLTNPIWVNTGHGQKP